MWKYWAFCANPTSRTSVASAVNAIAVQTQASVSLNTVRALVVRSIRLTVNPGSW